MTRSLLLLLVAICATPAVLAQDRDYARYEFVGGYAWERASNNARTYDRNGGLVFNGAAVQFDEKYQNYNGFYGEFNQNITRHWGLVTSFAGTYDTSDYVNVRTGRVFPASAQRYKLMFGPRYNFRWGRITPFAHALAGFEHMRVSFDDTLVDVRRAETAFAMALGGGVDLHLADHFEIRAIQVDYIPTFFNSTHQNNMRVGAGIKVK